jgi:hypothetical protein
MVMAMVKVKVKGRLKGRLKARVWMKAMAEDGFPPSSYCLLSCRGKVISKLSFEAIILSNYGAQLLVPKPVPLTFVDLKLLAFLF